MFDHDLKSEKSSYNFNLILLILYIFNLILLIMLIKRNNVTVYSTENVKKPRSQPSETYSLSRECDRKGDQVGVVSFFVSTRCQFQPRHLGTDIHVAFSFALYYYT